MASTASEIAFYACSPLEGDADARRRCVDEVQKYAEHVQPQTYLINANIELPVTFRVDGEYYAVASGQVQHVFRVPTGRVAVHVAGQGLLSVPGASSMRVSNPEGSVLQAITKGKSTHYVVGAPRRPPAYLPVYQPQYPASYQPQYRPVVTHPARPQGWYPQAPAATCSSIGTEDTLESWCALDGAAVEQFGNVKTCKHFFSSCQAQATPQINPSWTQTDSFSGPL